MYKSFRSCVSWALAAGAIYGTAAQAGWSGSGGKLFSDQGNPWWVQNTTVVRYCVKVDEEIFGISLSRLQELVPIGINYWKRNLAKLRSDGNSLPDLELFVVGTQSFTPECGPATDITFQFGFLDPVQVGPFKDNFGEVTDYVSVAVRTEYSKSNMRAKGFVYIAPEDGSLAPSIPNLRPRMWSSTSGESRLMRVLLHELGHVFGIGHSNSDDYHINFMNEAFPEGAVTMSDGGGVDPENLEPEEFFPTAGASYEPFQTTEFYGRPILGLTSIPEDEGYILYRWFKKPGKVELWGEVRDLPNVSSPRVWRRILDLQKTRAICFAYFNPITLYVPRSQTVTIEPLEGTRWGTGYLCEMLDPAAVLLVLASGTMAPVPAKIDFPHQFGISWTSGLTFLDVDHVVKTFPGPDWTVSAPGVETSDSLVKERPLSAHWKKVRAARKQLR